MIPFKQVYRMRNSKMDDWTIVMALLPLPNAQGLWMMRASSNKPEQMVHGRVFEGADGQVVVIAEDHQVTFEPLTVENWTDMREHVFGFDRLHTTLTSNEALQGWYWDEFAHNGDGVEIDKGTIVNRLAGMFSS